MLKRFSYFYFMRNLPGRIQDVVPSHIAYWKENCVSVCHGGPFADKSGGLIIFEANSYEEAETIANGDPFVTEGLLEQRWLKEWLASK